MSLEDCGVRRIMGITQEAIYAAWQEIILNAVVLVLLVVVNHVFEAAPLHEGHPLCQPASLLQLLAALPRAPCNMPARTSGPAPPYRC